MDLYLPTSGLDQYKSASQRARVGTESWGAANFFCPACQSPRLEPSPQGTAAIDYVCPSCDARFQLKSQSKPIRGRIVDAAYSEMKRAILEDRTPNLYVLHYDLTGWLVRTVILVPHFAFALSAIERRPPLAATARRAGWVGCNILLDKIATHARIPVVKDGKAQTKEAVREAYQRLRPLEKLRVEKRGWTLDVLQVVQSLDAGCRPEGTALHLNLRCSPPDEVGINAGTALHAERPELGRAEAAPLHKTFSLQDVYQFEKDLSRLHSANRNIQAKIRQQLQVLRDLGLVEFLGGGEYRLT